MPPSSASTTATERDLSRVQAEIGKLIQALKDGVPASIVQDPLIALRRSKPSFAPAWTGQSNRLPCAIRTWRIFTGRR